MLVQPYTIEVQNENNQTNTYVISQEPPLVSESSKIWPLAIASAISPSNSTVKFTISPPSPYYAYAMSSEGEPGHGVMAETKVKQPVTLGKENADGTITPGSSLEFVFKDGTLDLTRSGMDSKQGNGSFSIRTGADFTKDDVSNNNLLIGFGDQYQPWSALAPEPLTTYSFRPSRVFYLYSVNVHKGSIVDVQSISTVLKLDFTSHPITVVHAVHTSTGEFTLVTK